MTANVNNDACDRCGTCIGVCPANALLLLAGSLKVDSGRCTACGTCVAVCPFGALSLTPGSEETPEKR
jgi:ferredoxin